MQLKWKTKKPKPSIIDRIENGELTIEQGQSLLNLQQMAAAVSDSEHSVKDHGNLVDLRKTWGKVILIILIVTILSDMVLVYMVGSDKWKFTNNAYFLNVVITEHLIQVFGLVLIVLKSLFPSKEK